jgi:hypothetical protein
MTSVLAKKLGMKPGMKALITGAPVGYLNSLEPLPDGVAISSSGGGAFPFVQVFATRIAEVSKFARTLPKYAAPNTLVWISYPKKSSGTDTDLSRDVVREAMNGTGWRAVAIVAIDDVWAALRFRPTDQVRSCSKGSRRSPAKP